MTPRSGLALLGLSLALSLAAGCSAEGDDLEAYVSSVKQSKPAPRVRPLPEIPRLPSGPLPALDRDPFAPLKPAAR